MDFCPKCGAVLIQREKRSGCPRCSYSSKDKMKLKTSEAIKHDKKETAVMRGKEPQVFPTVNDECKKCKNTQAYFWTVQTRSADESETKFFKCTKCGNTRREYR